MQGSRPAAAPSGCRSLRTPARWSAGLLEVILSPAPAAGSRLTSGGDVVFECVFEKQALCAAYRSWESGSAVGCGFFGRRINLLRMDPTGPFLTRETTVQ
jgi:hypothetical protein